MRRPLVCLCFAEAFGLLLSYYTDLKMWHLCIFCAGVLILVWSNHKKAGFLLVLSFFILLGFLGMEAGQSRESKILLFKGQVVELSGVVTKAEIKDRYIAVTVKVRKCGSLDSAPCPANENSLIRLNIAKEESGAFAVYDLVGRNFKATGRVSEPQERRNPGCFDYRLYLKTKGIYTICDVSAYRFTKGDVENHFLHFLSVRKGDFFQRAQLTMGEDSFALLAGLLFGEKSYMQDEVYQEFQRNGIAHVLAVSGLHVGLLYAVLLRIFNGRKSIGVSLATVCAIFTYAALSNFAVSVLRASGMIILAIASRHFRRRYDLVTAASAVAMVFISLNPFQIFDSGFQLSFLAAYSLGVILPYVELKVLQVSDHLKKAWIFHVGKMMGPCLVMQICMAPLVAFQFLLFSPIGLIMNPPALLLAGLLMPAGLLMFMISVAAGPIYAVAPSGITAIDLVFAAASGVAEALCRCLQMLSETGGKIGGGGAWPAPPIGLLILFYGVIFFHFSEIKFISSRRKKHGLRRAAYFAVAAFACLFPVAAGLSSSVLPWEYDTPLLTFLDVGQGESLHIQIGGLNILVDGGGNFYTDIAEKTLQPYLLKNGITHIDLAVITHDDLDHSKGILELSVRMVIDRVIVAEPYQENPEAYDAIICSKLEYVSAGDTISLGENASLRILSPASGTALSASSNSNSLVMMLSYLGLDILLTGDMEMIQEAALAADASCDILKVAHHGSAGSTGPDFIAAASPSFAVISCGIGNSHGHPSSRVIELLENSGIIIGRTDISGALCLRSITEEFFVFKNASKEIVWQIPRKDFL